MSRKTAIIIGAGPAGLTAALEFLKRTDIKPIVIEASGSVGGLSRTIEFKGNRIDLGGHRFFSKSDRVIRWWLDLFPLQGAPAIDDLLLKRALPLSDLPGAPDPEREDRVMLTRERLSRIYFQRKFFSYPLALNATTINNLGLGKIATTGLSYVRARWRPIRPERNLEDFFINRFGRELYEIFFKDYTEKVWGISCHDIAPDWGRQRVKGISFREVIRNALRFPSNKQQPLNAPDVQTSFITRFWYPKLGPGQFWEEVASRILKMGGEIRLSSKAVRLSHDAQKILHATVQKQDGGDETIVGEYFISTMPIQELIGGLAPAPPTEIGQLAAGLQYRDFMMVGILAKKLSVAEKSARVTLNGLIPDQWLYIQESGVKVGRIQIFNNWSPYLVHDLKNAWIGMEYFCNEGDELWSMTQEAIVNKAITELRTLNIATSEDILDAVVVKQKKAYPAYFGTFEKFALIKNYADTFQNLFLIGRNGMHRYNNQDHSMLTAMTLVDNIKDGRSDKSNLWSVNPEDEYIEVT